MSDFHFIRPYWLLAFLPFIAYLFFSIKRQRSSNNWQKICDPELLPFILQQKESQNNRRPFFITSFAFALSLIAMAGPTWERLPSPVFRNSSALVIALDLSRSMDATDIKPSRLERARYKIADLLKKRRDGQTALLVYANSAFVVTPLTNDAKTINSQLNALTTNIMPAQGSNSALAIQKAVSLFQNASLLSGQILLISDDALDNIEIPDTYSLSILAVGTAQGAPIKLAQGGFLKDTEGNIVIPKLNSPAMRHAANITGGMFQPITDTDEDIDQLSAHFNKMNKDHATLENNLLLENWREVGVWLLFPILFLFSFAFRRGLLSLFFVFLLPIPKNSQAFEWQDLWQTQDQQAQESYAKGNYDEAAKRFTDPAWQAAAQYKSDTQRSEEDKTLPATTETGFYNQGNVLAKSDQLEEAINAYEHALKINPNHQDAQFNKHLVEQALEQKKQQKKQDQEKDPNKEPSDEQKDQQGEPSQDNPEQQSQPGKDEPEHNDDSQPETQESESEEAETNKQEKEKEQEGEPKDKQSNPEKSKEQSTDQAPQESDTDAEQSEQEQENQQWLRSIPDDPAELLKRKFKYQYSRQKQQRASQQW